MKAIASHNGLLAVDEAYRQLMHGESPLTAAVEGVTLVEDDPAELTVGYGGLPNEDGVVELDAAVMDGPTHRVGSVAGLRDVRHAAKVARMVMERTNRVMLVGEGAKTFALANGFAEENLLTDQAREMWLYWKRTRSEHDDWTRPTSQESDLDVERWFEKRFYGTQAREGDIREQDGPSKTGTVHCSAIAPNGNLACATTTSGHAFKLAGRVGDSPIAGAGLYVDNEIGSCGSIGHGEANLENLSSFLGVELMRGGMSPQDAGLETLRRVVAKTRPQDRDSDGRPKFNLQIFLLNKNGEHAGVAMWATKHYAIADENGPRLEECAALFRRNS